jgi:hypothetical protein
MAAGTAGHMALGMTQTANFLSAATAKIAGSRMDPASQNTHSLVNNYLQSQAGSFVSNKVGQSAPDLAKSVKNLRSNK